MTRHPSLGPIAGWADHEVLGVRHPLRLASEIELPPEDFMRMMVHVNASEVARLPTNTIASDLLATAALSLSAFYLETRRWSEFSEFSLHAEEQYLKIIAILDPVAMPFETVALAAIYYNFSVAHETRQDQVQAKRAWQFAMNQLGKLPADHGRVEDSRYVVEGALWRQGQILGIH